MTDPYVSQPAPTPTEPSVRTATEGTTGVSMPESGSSADVVKSQSRMVADDAAEGGKRVARVAADEAATVADEAKTQARSLWEQASSQLSNQAADQKSTLASWLRGLAEELRSMADASQRDLVAYGSPSAGTPGFATGLADRGANYARSAASWLDDREPSAILNEVSSFARRRPGTFLVIAATAGVVAGRLTRGLTAGEDGNEDRLEGRPDRYAGDRYADDRYAGERRVIAADATARSRNTAADVPGESSWSSTRSKHGQSDSDLDAGRQQSSSVSAGTPATGRNAARREGER